MSLQNKKHILITGGSGFVGLNIIHTILDHNFNYKITNLSNHPVNLPNVENIVCDVTKFDLQSLDQEFDYIIHLLALSNEKYCQDLHLAELINIDFTKRLLEFARNQKKLCKFVHLSTALVYASSNKPPISENDKVRWDVKTTYVFTKIIAENYAEYYRQKFNIPIVIFRLANIYGPYQKFDDSPFLVASKINQGVLEKKISVFNLKPVIDLIYSQDAVSAILKSLESDISGIYNLASGHGVSVEEVIIEISKQLNVSYSSMNKSTNMPSVFYCDVSKISSDLDWKPETKLREGIMKTINYYKTQLT